MAFVEFENVGKTYHMGEVEIHALHDTSFEVVRESDSPPDTAPDTPAYSGGTRRTSGPAPE